MNIKKCLICHDKESVATARKNFPDSTILFVGSLDTPEEKDMIILRNLPKNIENLPQFLTFTAWWAISHNSMFTDPDFIALFEWDTHTSPHFWNNVQNTVKESIDAVGLISAANHFYHIHSSPKLIESLESLKLSVPPTNWFSSSNCIIRRKKLDEFVSLYETQLDHLKDDSLCKWAHERVYASWLSTQRVEYVPGLMHWFANSHKNNFQ
jgi:hypothetical protein